MSLRYQSRLRRQREALLRGPMQGRDHRRAERLRLAEAAAQRAGEPDRHVTRLTDVEPPEED